MYSDGSSFEYIRESLEKNLLSNLEQDDRLPFEGLPLVIVFAASPHIPEKEALRLKDEGTNLAQSLQCPFLDVSRGGSGSENSADKAAISGGAVDAQFNPDRMEEALRALIENIRHRSGLLKICKAGGPGAAGGAELEPDIR